MNLEEKIRLARDIGVTEEELEKLSRDEDWRVRWEIAQNPNTSGETLAKLSEDADDSVRFHVAKNPHTSVKVLTKLSEDADEAVRKNVADNPNTSNSALERLSRDPYWLVRSRAVHNSSNFRIKEMLKVVMNSHLLIKNADFYRSGFSKLDVKFLNAWTDRLFEIGTEA